MSIGIYIAKYERYEAVDAYKDRLTPEQIEEIEETNIDWLLTLTDTGYVISPAADDNIKG